MKKVFLLNSSPTPYKSPLIERLAAREGIDLFVAFCVWKSGTRPWDLGELKGVRHEVLGGWHIPKGKGNYIRINWPVISRLRSENPDVVVIAGYNHPTMMMAIAYCVFTNTPFVIQAETWVERTGLKAKLKQMLLHPILFKAGAFLVTGTLGRKYWVSRGYDENKIRVFANTPDVEYFMQKRAEVKDEERVALRESWQCGSRQVAVFVGRLIKVKGVDLLLGAMREMEDEDRPFLVIVGDGTEREELERLAEGMPVAFLGFLQIDDLPAIYAAADYFVLPSILEPWGVVVNEGMACGLPLMLSEQVGAHADLLEPSIRHGNGALVEGPTVENLKEGMMKMAMASDEDLSRMGIRSQNIIQGWKYGASVQGFEEACDLALQFRGQ